MPNPHQGIEYFPIPIRATLFDKFLSTKGYGNIPLFPKYGSPNLVVDVKYDPTIITT